ncbi:hypothetical protein EVAR_95835_1 [Eumeta japonica]|uniref:Uncharacterized protein n=1 Tax=Eumeta variegata TaxID=151549 RepID=A0A4C1VNB2_EUMVA|nr:hypothetical protein EVAR_95835_1 [Eumeta japonica]
MRAKFNTMTYALVVDFNDQRTAGRLPTLSPDKNVVVTLKWSSVRARGRLTPDIQYSAAAQRPSLPNYSRFYAQCALFIGCLICIRIAKLPIVISIATSVWRTLEIENPLKRSGGSASDRRRNLRKPDRDDAEFIRFRPPPPTAPPALTSTT